MTTKIEWVKNADGTQGEVWNPVTGCSKVSQGCKHCYAEREWGRLSANSQTVYFGRAFTDVQCHPERLVQPLRWKKPRMIFVNSMSDLYHPDVPFDFIDRVFAVMALARRHTFQVLTKRPARMLEYYNSFSWKRVVESCRDQDGASLIPGYTMQAIEHHFGLMADSDLNFERHDVWPLPNVWPGVSIENQETADERIPLLLQIQAAVHWVSAEPLLGHIDLRALPSASGIGRYLDALSNAGVDSGALIPSKIDWVVAGGETKGRPIHPDWVRSLHDQCEEAGVPFLMKQWGDFANADAAGLDINECYENARVGGWVEYDGTYSMGESAQPKHKGAAHVFRVGKKAAGRLLDGVLHNDFPRGGTSC
jgi:protein gp37